MLPELFQTQFIPPYNLWVSFLLLIEQPRSTSFSRILTLLDPGACTWLSSLLILWTKTEWRPVPWLFLQLLNHGIFQTVSLHWRPLMRAFCFFFQDWKMKLRTGRVWAGKSKLPQWVLRHSVSTPFPLPFVQQPLFLCKVQLLSSRYYLRWMQKDGADPGKLHYGFHHSDTP